MGDMDVGGVEVGGSVAECALAALLDEGVTVDVRPFLDEVIANPAKLAEAHRLLPPVDQARLTALLPEWENGLTETHPQLVEAVRDVKESLDETPTARSLQRRLDKAWAPAVGDRCEGGFLAAVEGVRRRTDWFPATIVELRTPKVRVRYDDGNVR